MRKFSRAYLLITALATAGCVLILLDHSEYDVARAFEGAVECADASSPDCYQLYPGTITEIHRYEVSEGEQDTVAIATQGKVIRISLRPAKAVASLLQPDAPVQVEWYVGAVSTVWIAGRPIPSTSSPTSHANVGYIGSILVWLAALFLAIVLLNRRMRELLAAVRILPEGSVRGSEVLLPSGSPGWIVRPTVGQALLLPLGVAALVLVSIRPVMNPNTRLIALVGDVVLLALILGRLALTLRNCRLTFDRSSIGIVHTMGRHKTWPLAAIQEAAIVGVRWTDWTVPTVLFVGRDGSNVFAVTSLFWYLEEVTAACVEVGITLSVGYEPSRQRRVNWPRRARGLAFSIVTTVFVALAFLPLPPSNS